jgi:aldehyde:ferredoxin oxidoreductase
MEKKKISGYNGQVLRVNLSQQTVKSEAIDESLCRRFLGGAGFIMYYLWKELKGGSDPLGPENKLIFALGPLSGLPFPGAGRHCVGAKSPLTGGIGKAEAGGYWAAELKRAGFDAVIIEGKAGKPVYLWIHDKDAEIRDASHLWGRETKETEAAIREELGDSHVQVAMIGPGGENMVRYTCIMHGLHDAAARGGLGAVMGAKNLKAVAVRGHATPDIADSKKLKTIARELVQNVDFGELSEYGTGGPFMELFESIGNLPVHNFRDGLFPGVKRIHAGVIKEMMRVGMEGCFACPAKCKKIVKTDEPYTVDPAYGGPEYESIAALGSNCGVDNLHAIVKANERCNAYSLDTISTGGVIAFAMECFEKGLLTLEETGGIDLRFGNDKALLEIIELITRRKGVGGLLAEGTARMAERIGQGADAFAMQVKGLEPGMHEPRLNPGMGLGFMLSPHGADHCASLLELMDLSENFMKEWQSLGMLDVPAMDGLSPTKVEIFRLKHFKSFISDSLCVCSLLFLLPKWTFKKLAEVLEALTGWDTTPVELLRIAERIVTLARLINVREGFGATDDYLPRRFFQPKTDGPLSNKALDAAAYENAKRYYYMIMGWDVNGVPLPEKVEELGIELIK